jgi:cytochrome c-type biogenesis protein CcmH
MIHAKRPLQILLAVLILATIVIPAAAQDNGGSDTTAVSDDAVNEVARDIYCPVCENTPLDVCQTKACADWRELIRTKLSEGQSDQQIFDYFARQYGDGVLANPPRRGVSLIVLWVLPVVLLLVGVLFFSRYMRGLRGAETETVSTVPSVAVADKPLTTAEPAHDDYLARVEEELKKSNE